MVVEDRKDDNADVEGSEERRKVHGAEGAC